MLFFYVFRINFRKDSITTRIPNWNFVAVTRNEDGQRLYVRVTEAKRNVIAKTRPAAGLLSVSYSQLKAEAEEIVSILFCLKNLKMKIHVKFKETFSTKI